jgi:NEDD8-activating enzyme E1 regulatory subunit
MGSQSCSCGLISRVVVQALEFDTGGNEAALFLTMRAADVFFEKHQRCPGSTTCPGDLAWEEDIPILRSLVSETVTDLGLPADCVKDDVVKEFCRAAGPEIHCVSALMGGIAAQEAIKILLQQWVPLDGVLIYDGIKASSRVLCV